VSRLTGFGLFAVTAMLVCYALEKRSRWFILAFSFACLLGSVYGFLQGAWPFGIVEGIWSLVAVRRWWQATRAASLSLGS
jgi:hypothetical protein